jgi:DsbC/DsbD-like thiol-disulfide interchange protein
MMMLLAVSGCAETGAGASADSESATARDDEPAKSAIEASTTGSDENKTAADFVSLRVTADTATITPGLTFHLAFIFDVDPHWHIYWIHPGDSGMPTQIEIDAPNGFAVGDVMFPRPQVIRTPTETTYGYEKQAVLFVPITAPDRLSPEEVSFTADVGYLVCTTVCLLGSANVSVSIPASSKSGVDAASRSISAAEAELIDAYLARVPRPVEELTGSTMRLDDDRFIVEGPAGEHHRVGLLPIPVPGVRFGKPDASVSDGMFRISVPIDLDPTNALGKPMAIRGVVALGERLDEPSYEFNLPVDGDTVSAGD